MSESSFAQIDYSLRRGLGYVPMKFAFNRSYRNCIAKDLNEKVCGKRFRPNAPKHMYCAECKRKGYNQNMKGNVYEKSKG